jgi:pimeloyl-ACP methyl ester carboxylesterase
MLECTIHRSGSPVVLLANLPRAGHFLLLEQPEAVTRAVAEFVGTGAVTR